ncbi:peptide deformylase [Dysgonomonas macrotermitis]|uniref:Peptide deformylase n=1 Tax=Dysgonomonas macrotermitis TaxID=1346286 RepID=A0A1M5CEK9_9BACT|nr:peptide deformylase [Dysgonomonas macrotermitis]SHF53178.1 peptide deformylase [Dysgonomonas macrotermitis]
MKHLFFILFTLLSLNSMAQLNTKEKALINSGNEITPFRVLKVTDKEDSLFLRTPCVDFDLNRDKKEIALLIARLKVTMAEESGVGIAAPQVGIGRNLFLFMRIDIPEHPVVAAINPKIVNRPEETVCFERDGCLSIPGISGNSVRYPWVDVEYTNEEGQLVRERLQGYSRQTDFTGVIFQHEFDHLQGVLFIDKLCPELP